MRDSLATARRERDAAKAEQQAAATAGGAGREEEKKQLQRQHEDAMGAATMSVMQFPPRESFRTWVSLLWRKGMWDRFFLSVSARTTCSRKLSDLLMYIASVRTWEGPWG